MKLPAPVPSLPAARAHAALAGLLAAGLFIAGVTATASLAYAGDLFPAALTSALTFAGFYFTQGYAFARFDDLIEARTAARNEQAARAITSGTRVDLTPIRTPAPHSTPAAPVPPPRPAVERLPGSRLVESPVSVSGAFRAAVASVPALPTPAGARAERSIRAAAQDPGRHRPETFAQTSAFGAVRSAR